MWEEKQEGTARNLRMLIIKICLFVMGLYGTEE